MGKLLMEDESYVIRGVVYEVYREMGCGFLEAVYQECMEKELARQKVPFESQKELRLTFKGEPLKQTYKPDFICYGKIIVEIKAVKQLTADFRAQLVNYLKGTKFQLGFLVNFGSYPKATIERFVL